MIHRRKQKERSFAYEKVSKRSRINEGLEGEIKIFKIRHVHVPNIKNERLYVIYMN